MRVIAGRLRGKKIKAPKGLATRPVLARVREALFSILGDIGGLSFLDLYAGTGAVGLEALSRGAESVMFVELGSVQCRIISENVASTGKDAVIMHTDVMRALKKFHKDGKIFDVVFADPPYEQGLSQETIRTVCEGNILSGTGIMAVTARSSEYLPEKAGFCEMILDRRYGNTRLTLYAPKNNTFPEV